MNEKKYTSLLDSNVAHFPLIGPVYAKKLERLGIKTLSDLLRHYPFRYDDLSNNSAIDSLQEGELVTLKGTIIDIKSFRTKTGKTMQTAQFSDGSGLIKINWFNQPFLVHNFQRNPQVSLSGKVKIFSGKPTLSSPQYEILKNFTLSENEGPAPIHTGRLVPVYPETAGISSKWLRSRLDALLRTLPPLNETVPPNVISDMPSFDWAIRSIHFPSTITDAVEAKNRLAFDELFIWQMVAQLRKRSWKSEINHWTSLKLNPETMETYLDHLPYKLTHDQLNSINDILNDIQLTHPMNRLLQGDVGSGKTVVAGAIMYLCATQGFRSILMAPTEILASQHYQTLQTVLGSLGIKIALCTRSHREDISQAQIIVGTHALLHRELPDNIAFYVIDEQHRFGVSQRSQLLHLPNTPHLLSMTATPIPRTIALTLYAELDVSVIKEMPLGRLPVKTWVVNEAKRAGAYSWIRQQIQNGGQVFVVCPLIEKSENIQMTEIKAAEVEFERLKQHIFPDFKLGLVHGKLKNAAKDQVIKEFHQQKLDILVATSVIEVGIDIKNATIMVIEGAERFGLAQLHQLRGRVGRSTAQSYCLLFSSTESANIRRLKYLETIHSGFDLAEIDLKLRGPGDIYGQQQSGFIDLKLASFNDEALILKTHHSAIEVLKHDPNLNDAPLLMAKIQSIISHLSDPN